MSPAQRAERRRIAELLLDRARRDGDTLCRELACLREQSAPLSVELATLATLGALLDYQAAITDQMVSWCEEEARASAAAQLGEPREAWRWPWAGSELLLGELRPGEAAPCVALCLGCAARWRVLDPGLAVTSYGLFRCPRCADLVLG